MLQVRQRLRRLSDSLWTFGKEHVYEPSASIINEVRSICTSRRRLPHPHPVIITCIITHISITHQCSYHHHRMYQVLFAKKAFGDGHGAKRLADTTSALRQMLFEFSRDRCPELAAEARALR